MSISKKYWISEDNEIQLETRKILNEYLLNLKLENKAVSTVTKYKAVLERFLKETPIPVNKLTADDLLKWIQEYSIGKKEKTMDLVLSVLSSFFKFCLEDDYMSKMVMKKRWRPKIPQSLPKYLSGEEYSKVKRVSEQFSLRDRSLILFLFSSGCRRFEVTQLKIQDVDLKKRTALVKGKGNKIRSVHYSVECALILNEYLSTREYSQSDPLFLNRWGQPLGQAGIYKVIKKLGEAANLAQTLHPHACRHTFATNLLAKGAELNFIAEELGHSNLNTTRVYARIPTEDMILTYQNLMG